MFTVEILAYTNKSLMKRISFIAVLFFISNLSIGQNVLRYTNGFIVAKVYEGKVLKDSVPMGKNVIITKDTFFNNYTLTCTDVNGKRLAFEFDFVSNDKGILMLKDKTSGDLFWAVDDLFLNGALLLTNFGGNQSAQLQIFGMQKN